MLLKSLYIIFFFQKIKLFLPFNLVVFLPLLKEASENIRPKEEKDCRPIQRINTACLIRIFSFFDFVFDPIKNPFKNTFIVSSANTLNSDESNIFVVLLSIRVFISCVCLPIDSTCLKTVRYEHVFVKYTPVLHSLSAYLTADDNILDRSKFKASADNRLTLSKTTNFRLFQTERFCRRQFKI